MPNTRQKNHSRFNDSNVNGFISYLMRLNRQFFLFLQVHLR